MASRLARFALHCNIAVALAACHHAGGQPCTRDSDCPSHFCKADGTCGPASADAPAQGDGGVDAQVVGCTPNRDGSISAAELPLRAGATARFRIATSATWDTAGTSSGSGMRTWDLTGQLANDTDTTVTLSAPAGAWWAADYASASYATKLSASSDLLGVFQVDANGVVLLGVVSPQGGTYKTELSYDPPARILAVPFMAGSTWSTTSTVSGYVQGAIGAYTEKYNSRVDEVGTMTTPYGAFPVLRVATDMTRTSGGATIASNRTFSWAAECFGMVATAQSQNFSTSAEFSDDAEVRRLIP